MSSGRDTQERRVLVVDDDQDVRTALQMALAYEGWEVDLADGGEEALAHLEEAWTGEAGPEVVLLDIKMPGMDGLEVLERIRQMDPGLAVIMISGHGDVPTAVDAMRRGADDFLEKPVDGDRLSATLARVMERAALRAENRRLRSALDEDYRLLGASRSLRALVARIEQVASSDARLLLTGEPGTGKDLVARQVHALSARSPGPFVACNAAALPHGLVESELFGHAKGAFTGALARRDGLFVTADGGTLFLDEIGEVAADVQAKLLRVLEDGRVQPVGSDESVQVDVRVIAATNRDLPALVREGGFRDDLYWRLAVVTLELPPLRERADDISELARVFAGRAASTHGRPEPVLHAGLVEALEARSWPGNVRELRNVMERMVVMSPSRELRASDLEEGGMAPTLPGLPEGGSWKEFRAAAEAAFLRRRLEANRWNVRKTADQIDMPRSHIYRLMDRYGLKRPDPDPPTR